MPQAAAINPATLPLRDIHLPPAIGWWPPAPGWWGLAGLLLLGVLAGLWLRRRTRRRRWRKLALRQLEGLTGQSDRSPAELAAALSRLLRQAALCHYPPAECAGLCGPEWLAFLDRPFADRPFTEGVGRCLLQAPYAPQSEVDAAALLQLCRRWLRQLPPAPRPARRRR